jgi:hypothetical protein
MALGVGTKTTVLPFALALVVVAILLHRDRIEIDGRALLTSSIWTAVVGVVGGLWYARTFYSHGSPLWPTTALPWGDPLPAEQAKLRNFLSVPGATLDGRVNEYRRALSGHLVALVAAPLLGLAAGRRVAVWGAIATIVGVLVWMAAPTTGVSSDPFLAQAIVGAIRYLMPTLALACVALAVVTTSPRRVVALAAIVALVLVVGWNVIQLLALGSPLLPSGAVLAAGAAIGIGASWRISAETRSARAGRPVPLAFAVAAVVLLAVTILAGSDGFSRRHAIEFGVGGGVMDWLDAHPQLAERDIAMTPVVNGMFTGDRLERNVTLIPAAESCAGVRARLDRQVVVLVGGPEPSRTTERTPAAACLVRDAPAIVDGNYWVYAAGS